MRVMAVVALTNAILALEGVAQAAPRTILEADLMPASSTCAASGEPLRRGPAPICRSTVRLDFGRADHLFQLRLEAAVLRALPDDAPIRAPAEEPQHCQEDRKEPGVFLCAGSGGLGECLVDTTDAAGRGEHGPLIEAYCVLVEPMRFVVHDATNRVRFSEEVSVVGCLADPAVIGPALPRLDIVADRGVNVCSAELRVVRQGAAARMNPLARMAPGWKLRVWQDGGSYTAVFAPPRRP